MFLCAFIERLFIQILVPKSKKNILIYRFEWRALVSVVVKTKISYIYRIQILAKAKKKNRFDKIQSKRIDYSKELPQQI